MTQNSLFKKKVVEIVQMVPHGKVASYGQIAAYIGVPRAARQVGWVLRESHEDMPWWRVLNNSGRISIEGNWDADKPLQKRLLEAEGIVISETFCLDIEKYRYHMPMKDLQNLQLTPTYIEGIIAKYGI